MPLKIFLSIYRHSVVLLVFFLALSSSQSSSYYDCENEGCPWTVAPPVCGVNGVTYANECLAFCQVSSSASFTKPVMMLLLYRVEDALSSKQGFAVFFFSART